MTSNKITNLDQKQNTLIYVSSHDKDELRKTDIKACIDKCTSGFEKYIIEYFDRNYLKKNLTLSQNLEFHLNIANMNLNEFLQKNHLIKIYSIHKNTLCKDITKKNYDLISFFVYLHINRIYLIDNVNLAAIISSFDETYLSLLDKYFKENILIYVHRFHIGQLRKISHYFNNFAIFEDGNDTIIYKQPDFREYIKQKIINYDS